jgi:hypothetical protein
MDITMRVAQSSCPADIKPTSAPAATMPMKMSIRMCGFPAAERTPAATHCKPGNTDALR